MKIRFLIMKRITLLLVLFHTATAFAAKEPISEVTMESVTDPSYVKVILYILAVLIGIAGGVIVIFIKMQDDNANVRPKIIATVAACIMLIAVATVLPQFFGYEADGSAGQLLASLPQTESEDLGNASEFGKVDGDYIKTDIPSLDDPRWQDDPNYKIITVGGKAITVSCFLNQTYEACGGESSDSYDRTLDAINDMYRKGLFDTETYNTLMFNVGSVPHCLSSCVPSRLQKRN